MQCFAQMTGVDAKPPTDPLVGQVLAGRFRVVRLIDRGGMGRVYEALQEPLGRKCAVKTLDLADPRGEYKARFFNEARLCAQLSHPNTIRIFDYGSTDDGVYFFAMEFLEGRTLRTAIKADGRFTPRRAVHVFRQLCSALGEAHASGIVHRDLKPANVYLCAHGDDPDFAKVLDFGLVKELSVDAGLSSRDVVLGSPMYMAPEQIEAKEVDGRCDVYAMGLMLWSTLTARAPYRAKNSQALLAQQIMKDPPTFEEALGPDHGIPASLEQLVRFAITKDPAERLASMRELARGLVIVGRELDGVVPPVTFGLTDGVLEVPEAARLEAEVTLPRAPAMAGEVEIPSGATLRSSADASTGGSAPYATLGAVGVVLAGGAMGGLGLVGVLLLGVLGLGLWGVLSPTTEPAEPVGEQVEAVVTEPEAQPASPHAVEVDSAPSTADVFRDDVLIGTTPIELKVPPGETWELRVARPGYTSRMVSIDGSANTVMVRLDKVLVAPAPSPRSGPVAPAPEPRTGLGREVRDPWDD